ncbi:hypothetical protein [Neptunomonas antarctica]|uniref:hypothetical protein n=1 Tax=Neptunomonas antarctica TaxID=619304 RepID=UPI001EE4C38B|nr:hypothetical protein [Neptunomonas antarctica]
MIRYSSSSLISVLPWLWDWSAFYGWPLVRWITAENNYRARSVYDKLATKTHWQTYQLAID